MAFTPKKRKNLEAAQKYAQKGQYDKALKEYVRLLQADPRDSNLRLKIGDLYLKLGEVPRAIESYTQVAEEFSKGGFDAKAVAIYKQILRVNEDNLEARVALGDHFQRMGLRSDALREFQTAVDLCQRRDLKREAFDLLKRVASLDPSNVANRLNLAALLRSEGLERESRDEYSALLAEVMNQTGVEVRARVASQALESFPDHREALLALVSAKIAQGQAKEALEDLESAAVHHDGDVEVLEARINALETLDDAEGVQSAWLELAEAYKRRGEVEKARDVLQRHASPADLALVAEDTTSHSILLVDAASGHEEVDPDPDFEVSDAPSMRALATAGTSVEDLLAEARISFEFGDPSEARKLARLVLDRERSNAGARELIARIDGGPGGRLDATPEFELDAPELERQLGAVPAPSPVAEEEPAEAQDSMSLPDIEIVLEDEADRDDAYASVDPPSELDVEISESSTDGSIEFEIDLDEPAGLALVAESELASDSPADAAEDEPPVFDSLQVAESLEEAEFYLGQGMLEEAEKLFRGILAIAPANPRALLRIGEIEQRRTPSPEGRAAAGPARPPRHEAPSAAEALPEIPELEIEGTGSLRPRLVPPEIDTSPTPPSPVVGFWELPPDEGSSSTASGELLVEIDEPGDGGLEPPGRDASASSTTEATFDPAELLESADDFGLSEPCAAPDDSTLAEEDGFDLAKELEDLEQTGELTLPEAAAQGFDAVFHSFKKAIQQQIGDEDADAHYDLAIAYKEMGLLEDALRELAAVQSQGARLIETLSLMATCKLGLGRPQEAVTDLKGALQIARTPELQLPLRYELAEALIAAGKPGEALAQFKRVAADDPAYRDIQDRISELQ